MAKSLNINTNVNDNLPSERKGNGSLGEGKGQIPSYIASEKGGKARSNSYNKRAVGPQKSFKFGK